MNSAGKSVGILTSKAVNAVRMSVLPDSGGVVFTGGPLCFFALLGCATSLATFETPCCTTRGSKLSNANQPLGPITSSTSAMISGGGSCGSGHFKPHSPPEESGFTAPALDSLNN